jgi:5-methylcytosine-specific restriction endonuclease McrA
VSLKPKSKIPKNWIVKVLRDISYKRPEYKEAKDKMRIDVGTYRCEICQCLMYEGTSDKRFNEFRLKYSELKRQKPQLDHKDPVVDISKGWEGFDLYIERLFCDTEGLQVLCKECHDIKSAKEAGDRAETRKGKKK